MSSSHNDVISGASGQQNTGKNARVGRVGYAVWVCLLVLTGVGCRATTSPSTACSSNTLEHVIFQPSVSYDQAVAAISDLGLRLADVCYELHQSQGQRPAWRAMGQEQAYQASGSLIVAPTTDASEHWQDQVKSLAGVVNIQTITSSGC